MIELYCFNTSIVVEVWVNYICKALNFSLVFDMYTSIFTSECVNLLGSRLVSEWKVEALQYALFCSHILHTLCTVKFW